MSVKSDGHAVITNLEAHPSAAHTFMLPNSKKTEMLVIGPAFHSIAAESVCLVSARPHFCNILLPGLPQASMKSFQMVHNAATNLSNKTRNLTMLHQF